MATIITKNSSTAGSAPSAAQLQKGELAVNLEDKVIYTKKADGTVISLSNAGDVTLTGTQTLTNKTLTSPVINTPNVTGGTFSGVTLNDGYKEEIFTITDGASVDLNPANGSIQLWTLGANRSPTATNFTNGQSMTLMIDDGTAYTITWPSVTWKTNGGVAPTLNTTGYTVVVLWEVGNVLYGARVGDA